MPLHDKSPWGRLAAPTGDSSSARNATPKKENLSQLLSIKQLVESAVIASIQIGKVNLRDKVQKLSID